MLKRRLATLLGALRSALRSPLRSAWPAALQAALHASMLALISLPAAAAAPKDISVVYLGAYDCFYCQFWEARDKDELLASKEGRVIRFFEVKGETLHKPVVETDYPEELKWLARRIGPSRGVPRFLLIVDGVIEKSVYGTSAYDTVFLPALRKAVARRQGKGSAIDRSTNATLSFRSAYSPGA